MSSKKNIRNRKNVYHDLVHSCSVVPIKLKSVKDKTVKEDLLFLLKKGIIKKVGKFLKPSDLHWDKEFSL